MPERPSRVAWIVAAVLFVALAAAGVVLAARDGEGDGPAGPSTTTTTSASSTSSPSTTAGVTTSTTSAGAAATAVYPTGSATGFDGPEAAARGFALDFLGFVDPVFGPYQAGDSQSGEVEVRPVATGPVTTVLVRRFGERWWVLGAATQNIELRAPSALDAISSPARLRGTSTAFEANVSVEVRQDGERRPIGEGFVMGGSMGEFGPFDGTVTFAAPSAAAGALVLSTSSMENGNLWEATVVRVRFEGEAGCASGTKPSPDDDETVVTAFFNCGLDGEVVPVHRTVEKTTGLLRASLEQLLAGPTAAERNAGLESWFGAPTAGMLEKVTIVEGRATVDLEDLRGVIPNASSSAGSRLLLAQLDATVFQFSSVRSVIYRIEGDCEAFNEWLQFGGCDQRTRPTS